MTYWQSRTTLLPFKLQWKTHFSSCMIMHHATNPEDIKELLKEAHVPVMKWPAQSPDLNLIENLWPDLKARFRKQFFSLGYHPSRSPAILQQCERLLQEVWQSTAPELIMKLIESMPRRVEAV